MYENSPCVGAVNGADMGAFGVGCTESYNYSLDLDGQDDYVDFGNNDSFNFGVGFQLALG